MSVATSGAQADGRSFVPAISGDGRYVAFYSDASNLVDGDTNAARDVFVHDRQTGETTRVSVSSSGAEANGDSFAPVLSGDGRFVAFSSFASNLVPGDSNGADDIFVRDRQTATTTRVSVAAGGGDPNYGSFSPALSADGRYVAYASDASNLVAGDTNSLRDIFVYDRQTGTTTRVSVDSAGGQADLESATPVLNADGRYVAFSSFADNLILGDTNEGSDIFVRDRLTGTTTRVSVYAGDIEAEGDALRPSISADGRYVAFDSDDWDLVWGDTNDVFDVFVHDRQTGYTTRVSVDDSGVQADGPSYRPSISGDGRFVAFYTEAANLVPGDTNGAQDVILADRLSGAAKRVSLAGGGAEGNADSVRPALSADGKLVAFESDASNLAAGDTNAFTDVFLQDRVAAAPPPPKAAKCVVPRVIGMRLAIARRKIAKANCKVGRIRRAKVRSSRRIGKVLSQSPRSGLTRPKGTNVNLVLGRR